MTESDRHASLGPDDQTMARLLRLAGRPPSISAERASRVREAVSAEWRSRVRRRAVVRGGVAVLVAAASIAGVVVAVGVLRSRADLPTATEQVAVVARAEGALRGVGRARGQDQLVAQDRVMSGEWLETSASGRAAVRTLLQETSVRLDAGTRMRWLSPGVIELARGAVYVDTANGAPPMEVRTPLGTAIDVGTQFEVRLDTDVLRVRVRTGAVAVRRGRETFQAVSGTELTMTPRGAETRAISPFGSPWEWVADISPAFSMEGKSLREFLTHLAKENGWTLQYADPDLAREAAEIMLHGSVDGLRAEDALAVAVQTSGLAHRLENGQLMLFRPAPNSKSP